MKRHVFSHRRGAPALAAALVVAWGCAAGDGARDGEGMPPELVLVSDRDGAGLDLYLHTLGSEQFTRVTSDSGNDYGPEWSPDGARILFENDAEGNWEIYVARADGSERTNLSRFEDYDGGASFSPDGSEIVFTSRREAIVSGHSGRDIWVMASDGSDLRRLTRNEMYEGAPRFSPDGSRIAFCRSVLSDSAGGPSNGEVFLMDRDGTNERRITSGPSFDCLADWSPDGSRLAYHGCAEDGCHIFVVDLAGGEPTRLTSDHSGNWPVWSPDGAWIAYTATHDEQTDIWLVRPDGSERLQVTTHPGRDEVAAWRPRSP